MRSSKRRRIYLLQWIYAAVTICKSASAVQYVGTDSDQKCVCFDIRNGVAFKGGTVQGCQRTLGRIAALTPRSQGGVGLSQFLCGNDPWLEYSHICMDTCRDEDLPTAGCLAANAVDSSGDWSDQARFPDQWAAWSSQIPQDKAGNGRMTAQNVPTLPSIGNPVSQAANTQVAVTTTPQRDSGAASSRTQPAEQSAPIVQHQLPSRLPASSDNQTTVARSNQKTTAASSTAATTKHDNHTSYAKAITSKTSQTSQNDSDESDSLNGPHRPTSTDEDDVYSAYATGDTTNNYTSTSSDDDLVDSTVPADTSKSTMSTIAWGSASTQTVTRTQGEGGASETIAFTLVTGVSLVTLGSGSADMQSTAVLRILRPPVLVAASAVWLILGLVLVHAGV